MKKNISTWQLALMTAAAVISLRGLPMMAQEELTMFFLHFLCYFPVPDTGGFGRCRIR